MDNRVTFDIDGAVARIWLDRPAKLNCLDVDMVEALLETLDAVESDANVRVIVLRGRGGTFCSGFDLGEWASDAVDDQSAVSIARRMVTLCDRLDSSPLPSVAVVEGHAVAAGFELLIACDFAVAAQDARIGDVHIRRALISGAGSLYRLPQIVGMRRAKELLVTGRLVTGAEAERWGLVNLAAPADGLDAAVDEFVSRIGDKSPFQAALTKSLVSTSFEASKSALQVMESLAVRVTHGSEDAKEGVASFLEERPPRWQQAGSGGSGPERSAPSHRRS